MTVLHALGLLLVAASCDKVPKPSSDSTAPTLEWVVTNDETNEQSVFQGNGSLNVGQGDTFTVTLKAKDPEGIHEITLGGNTQWTCKSGGDFVQTAGPSFGSTDTQTLNPDSEGNVLTEIFLLRDVEAGPYSCQQGLSFGGATERLSGTGENYFNGSAQGELVFNVSA